jgi:glycerol-3-phosphate dehydrogenase
LANIGVKERRNPEIVPHVIVVGAGSTGSATAHDLALRGLRVTVIERGEVASGTTGRNHCLLHSGGRYCVTDTIKVSPSVERAIIPRAALAPFELMESRSCRALRE